MDEYDYQPQIELETVGKNRKKNLCITFSRKRGRVLIYRAAVHELNDPEYIRFLFNKKQSKLALQVCEPVDQDTFKVPDLPTGKDIQFEIASLNFVSIIYDLMKWKPEGTYRIRGILVEKYRLLLFDLMQAEEISDAEFIDPDAGSLTTD